MRVAPLVKCQSSINGEGGRQRCTGSGQQRRVMPSSTRGVQKVDTWWRGEPQGKGKERERALDSFSCLTWKVTLRVIVGYSSLSEVKCASRRNPAPSIYLNCCT